MVEELIKMIRSSLHRSQPKSRLNDEEIKEQMRKCWLANGMFSGYVDDIYDEWLRLGIENLMNERFGKRGKRK
jgi:hypothetical protein